MVELNTNTTYDWFINSIDEDVKTTVGKKVKIELGCVQHKFNIIEYYTPVEGEKLGKRLTELITKMELVKSGESIKPDVNVYLKRGMHLRGKVFRRWVDAKEEHYLFELNYDTIKPANSVDDLDSVKSQKKIQFTPKDLHNLRKVTMSCVSKDEAKEKVLSSAPELEKAFDHFLGTGEISFE